MTALAQQTVVGLAIKLAPRIREELAAGLPDEVRRRYAELCGLPASAIEDLDDAAVVARLSARLAADFASDFLAELMVALTEREN